MLNCKGQFGREGCLSANSSKMGPELTEQDSVEAWSRNELEVSLYSESQGLPSWVSTSVSSGSLESNDSIVESSEDDNFEVSELRRVFQMLDEDQDNFISVADLRHFMARLGFEISEKEALAMVQTVDKKGEGKVSLDEFCTLYQQSFDNDQSMLEAEGLSSDEDDSIQQAFRVFDKNGDGAITARELQVVLLSMGRPEGKTLESCERMISGVDTDGNGQVDIDEFKLMMSSKFRH